MLTPAQPVASSIVFAAAGVVTSPLPMTGIPRTACDDRADAGQVDGAAEALRPRAAMDEDRGHAGVLQRAGEVRAR